MRMGGSDRVHHLGRAELATQRILGRRGVEDEHVAAAQRRRQCLKLRRVLEDEEVDVADSSACSTRPYRIRRFSRDPL